ncbi:hypothetical protein ODZ83_10725 [Acaricomes phytoseiuli]|uniref:hypothetical protein n=1 Tax=Acaricomes phytoseiuli TaxID=291968 RepID=UPI002222972A|nr:hypothetical protein [Acaricomes phytoseiuli]MCW1250640.1 hypothetical protein [Acaricomes phytoseiuli]
MPKAARAIFNDLRRESSSAFLEGGLMFSLGSSLFTSGVLLLSSVVSAGVGTGLYAESSAVVQEDLAQSITWGYAKKM